MSYISLSSWLEAALVCALRRLDLGVVVGVNSVSLSTWWRTLFRETVV